jgi:hypothetical protein
VEIKLYEPVVEKSENASAHQPVYVPLVIELPLATDPNVAKNWIRVAL